MNERKVETIDVTKEKLSRDQIRVSSSRINVLEYLRDRGCVSQWHDSNEFELAKNLQNEYHLVEFDILQILNNAPEALVDLCNCIESYSERFTEDEILAMFTACQEGLRGPSEEQIQQAVIPIQDTIPMS